MRTLKQIKEDLQDQLDGSPPSTRAEENSLEGLESSFDETSSRDRVGEGSVVSGASSDSGGGGVEGDDDAAGGEEQLVEQSSSPAASASVAAASSLSSSANSPPKTRRARSASVAGLPAPSVRLKAPRLPSAGKPFSTAEIKSLLSLVGEHGRRWRHIAEKMEELGYQKRSADALRNKFDDLTPQARKEKVKGQTKTTYALSTSNGDKDLAWTLSLDALLLHLTRTCKRKVTRQRAGDVVDWPEVAKQIPGRSVSMLRARRAELVKMDEGRREKVNRLLKRLEEEEVVKEEEGRGEEIINEKAEETEEEEDRAESTPAMDALVEAALASPFSRPSPAPSSPNEPTFSYPSASTPSTSSPDIVYVSLPSPPSPDQPRVTLTFQGQALRTTTFEPFNRLPPPSFVLPTAAPITAAPSAAQQPFPYFLPRPSYGCGPSSSVSSSAPVASTSTSKPPPKVYHLPPNSSRKEERTPRFLPPASFPVFPTAFPPSSLAYVPPSYSAMSAPSTYGTGSCLDATERREESGIERAPGGVYR